MQATDWVVEVDTEVLVLVLLAELVPVAELVDEVELPVEVVELADEVDELVELPEDEVVVDVVEVPVGDVIVVRDDVVASAHSPESSSPWALSSP